MTYNGRLVAGLDPTPTDRDIDEAKCGADDDETANALAMSLRTRYTTGFRAGIEWAIDAIDQWGYFWRGALTDTTRRMNGAGTTVAKREVKKDA